MLSQIIHLTNNWLKWIEALTTGNDLQNIFDCPRTWVKRFWFFSFSQPIPLWLRSCFSSLTDACHPMGCCWSTWVPPNTTKRNLRSTGATVTTWTTVQWVNSKKPNLYSDQISRWCNSTRLHMVCMTCSVWPLFFIPPSQYAGCLWAPHPQYNSLCSHCPESLSNLFMLTLFTFSRDLSPLNLP